MTAVHAWWPSTLSSYLRTPHYIWTTKQCNCVPPDICTEGFDPRRTRHNNSEIIVDIYPLNNACEDSGRSDMCAAPIQYTAWCGIFYRCMNAIRTEETMTNRTKQFGIDRLLVGRM